jgi:hypothetical protein
MHFDSGVFFGCFANFGLNIFAEYSYFPKAVSVMILTKLPILTTGWICFLKIF